jgi:hypothetical protein
MHAVAAGDVHDKMQPCVVGQLDIPSCIIRDAIHPGCTIIVGTTSHEPVYSNLVKIFALYEIVNMSPRH